MWAKVYMQQHRCRPMMLLSGVSLNPRHCSTLLSKEALRLAIGRDWDGAALYPALLLWEEGQCAYVYF